MSYGSPLAKPITASKIRAEFNKQMGLAPGQNFNTTVLRGIRLYYPAEDRVFTIPRTGEIRFGWFEGAVSYVQPYPQQRITITDPNDAQGISNYGSSTFSITFTVDWQDSEFPSQRPQPTSKRAYVTWEQSPDNLSWYVVSGYNRVLTQANNSGVYSSTLPVSHTNAGVTYYRAVVSTELWAPDDTVTNSTGDIIDNVLGNPIIVSAGTSSSDEATLTLSAAAVTASGISLNVPDNKTSGPYYYVTRTFDDVVQETTTIRLLFKAPGTSDRTGSSTSWSANVPAATVNFDPAPGRSAVNSTTFEWIYSDNGGNDWYEIADISQAYTVDNAYELKFPNVDTNAINGYQFMVRITATQVLSNPSDTITTIAYTQPHILKLYSTALDPQFSLLGNKIASRSSPFNLEFVARNTGTASKFWYYTPDYSTAPVFTDPSGLLVCNDPSDVNGAKFVLTSTDTIPPGTSRTYSVIIQRVEDDSVPQVPDPDLVVYQESITVSVRTSTYKFISAPYSTVEGQTTLVTIEVTDPASDTLYWDYSLLTSDGTATDILDNAGDGPGGTRDSIALVPISTTGDSAVYRGTFSIVAPNDSPDRNVAQTESYTLGLYTSASGGTAVATTTLSIVDALSFYARSKRNFSISTYNPVIEYVRTDGAITSISKQSVTWSFDGDQSLPVDYFWADKTGEITYEWKLAGKTLVPETVANLNGSNIESPKKEYIFNTAAGTVRFDSFYSASLYELSDTWLPTPVGIDISQRFTPELLIRFYEIQGSNRIALAAGSTSHVGRQAAFTVSTTAVTIPKGVTSISTNTLTEGTDDHLSVTINTLNYIGKTLTITVSEGSNGSGYIARHPSSVKSKTVSVTADTMTVSMGRWSNNSTPVLFTESDVLRVTVSASEGTSGYTSKTSNVTVRNAAGSISIVGVSPSATSGVAHIREGESFSFKIVGTKISSVSWNLKTTSGSSVPSGSLDTSSGSDVSLTYANSRYESDTFTVTALHRPTNYTDLAMMLNASGSGVSTFTATSYYTIRNVDLSYGISPSVTSVREGESIKFNISAQGVAAGTTLYWSLLSDTGATSADTTTATTGTVVVNSDGSTTPSQITVTIAEDLLTPESGESFYMGLFTTSSYSGADRVAVSVPVTIIDVPPAVTAPSDIEIYAHISDSGVATLWLWPSGAYSTKATVGSGSSAIADLDPDLWTVELGVPGTTTWDRSNLNNGVHPGITSRWSSGSAGSGGLWLSFILDPNNGSRLLNGKLIVPVDIDVDSSHTLILRSKLVPSEYTTVTFYVTGFIPARYYDGVLK